VERGTAVLEIELCRKAPTDMLHPIKKQKNKNKNKKKREKPQKPQHLRYLPRRSEKQSRHLAPSLEALKLR
jgi:hypothetical protein